MVEEGYEEGEITYIFCDDDYLHKINVEALGHDTLTDIISFDYTVGKVVHGDVYISVDRVKENALELRQPFEVELLRVMAHGLLHYCGYNDKSSLERERMRKRESEHLDRYF